mgnify:FL=1|jgi:hypothetical protein|tara:strand:- start:227 stop:415 length:189 start_codon:yes stop_codon:yes gene_type:complete
MPRYSTKAKRYQILDEITENTKDALELAREEDTPRDVEIRCLLSLVVNDLDVLRGEEYGEKI